ncbi:MAG TPA: hypothetical protein VGI34_01960 [Candidatus Acidoferrales bacterium]|jgi:hypothetical protein
MRTLWRAIVRVLFWSYERGTWQYDVAVVGITLFVLFSPLVIHYTDQPSVGPAPASALVELRAMAPGQVATYRVDARLLATPIRTPELEHDLHVTVQKNVRELNHGRFEILRIEPIRGDGDTIAYYDVSVKP